MRSQWLGIAFGGALVALAFALEYSAARQPVRPPLSWVLGLGVLGAALNYTTLLRPSIDD